MSQGFPKSVNLVVCQKPVHLNPSAWAHHSKRGALQGHQSTWSEETHTGPGKRLSKRQGYEDPPKNT